jgi:transcriptional regulator with XRE-family HTH domain
VARKLLVHERVASICKAEGISPRQLGELLGWSEMKAWRTLVGKTRVRADDVPKLAKALKRRVSDFYNGDDLGKGKASKP